MNGMTDSLEKTPDDNSSLLAGPLYYIEYSITPSIPPEIIAVYSEAQGIVYGILINSYLTPDLIGMTFESSAETIKEDYFEGVVDFTNTLPRFDVLERKRDFLTEGEWENR